MRRAALTSGIALIAGVVSCTGEDQRSGARADTAVAARRATHAATPANDYVGLQYDVLPDGFHFEGGAVIPPSTGGLAGSFDFAHVNTPRGDMIWLDTLGPATTRGLPNRIVRAELRIPPIANDERLYLGSCEVEGKIDARVVAIAVSAAKDRQSTRVRQAWRANPVAARFDVIPVTGASCEEPGS
jgi:hypothetical protein